MPNALGIALRALRLSAGMTLAEVAEAAGVAPSYLSRAENGLVTPSPSWVHNLAHSIGKRMADDARTSRAAS